MPFFRCGGAGMAAIAERIVYDKLHSFFGDSVNLSFSIETAHIENGFGVSNSSAIIANTRGRSAQFDALRCFFESYNYSVTMAPESTNYNQQFAILCLSTGDPQSPQYPGSTSGGGDFSFFRAVYSPPAGGLTKFEQKMVDKVRNTMGDDFRIVFRIHTSFPVQVNGGNQRKNTFATSGDWAPKLEALFAGAGYSGAVNEINITKWSVGNGGTSATGLPVYTGVRSSQNRSDDTEQ